MAALRNPATTQGEPGANPRVSGDLAGLKARVRALRESMMAARVDYLRARLEMSLATGHQVDADRLTRQLRNVLNEERPKAKKRRGAMPTHSGRTANADQQTNKAACAAKD